MTETLPFPELSQWQSALAFLVFILLGIISILVMRAKARTHISQNPHLASGYEKLFKGLLIILTAPFAILLLGAILGKILLPTSFFDFSNSFILAFFGFIFLFDIWAVKSVFFGNGAEFLTEHDAGFSSKLTPNLVKFLTIGMLIAHVGSVAFLFLMKSMF